MRELLYRLMKKQEDGTFKCVGYMKIENGQVYYSIDGEEWKGWLSQTIGWEGGRKLPEGFNYIRSHYIPHDRADQYTGQKYPDRQRVFACDEVQIASHYDSDYWCHEYDGVVIYSEEHPEFIIEPIDCERHTTQDWNNIIKQTGIQGVTNDN